MNATGAAGGSVFALRRGDDLLVVAAGEAVLVPGWVPELLGAGPQRPGTVRLAGQDVSRWESARRVRAGLHVLGAVAVAGDVSVRDHLVAVAPHAADGVLAEAPLLAGRGDDLAGWLSGGERQVLGWLQAILARPRVIVLDVAGRGLDQPTLAWANVRIARWCDEGVAMLVHPGREEEEHWVVAGR